MRCLAVRKTGLNAGEQCDLPAKFGHLCGGHHRAKNVILVRVEQPIDDPLTETESTSTIEGLVNGVSNMGLRDLPTDTPNKSARRKSNLSIDGRLERDDGNNRLQINFHLRAERLEPDVNKTPVKVTPSKRLPQISPKAPKLMLSPPQLRKSPRAALDESPTHQIPPGVDKAQHPELTGIMLNPPDNKTGFIYICQIKYEMQQDSAKTVIKIGGSADIKQRMDQHLQMKACRMRLKPIRFYPDTVSHQIRNLNQVERVIHKSLVEYQYLKKCDCRSTHKELYEIHKDEIDHVVEIVEGWVSWSEKQYGFDRIHGRP